MTIEIKFRLAEHIKNCLETARKISESTKETTCFEFNGYYIFVKVEKIP